LECLRISPMTAHTMPFSNPQPTDSLVLRMLRAAWHMLQAGILLYGGGVSLYVLLHFLAGERWPWIAFANNFVPWWALGGLLAGTTALFSRWRWGLIALQVPGIVLFAGLYGALLLPRSTGVVSAEDTFTVATYNIIASQSNPADVVNVIATMDADITGLVEMGPAHSAQIERDLATQYPYQVHYPLLPVQGVSLLSRYPIVEEQIFRPQPDSMLHLRAVIDVDGVPLVVYVVHPPPPGRVMSPLTYDTARRDTDIEVLRRDWLAHESGPVIVVGDFNMSDLSDPYRAMDADFDDAFRAAGHGLGFTFPAQMPVGVLPRLLRIDYVWYNHTLTAVDAAVWHDSGTSDHRPVIAELAFKESTRLE
jgi:vancomycin resistance protein VanJ